MTARDIAKQEFRRKLNGFAVEEVRMYLASVAEEVERLNLENAELHEEVQRMRQEAQATREREATLQQTLISAQRMTDEMKEKGRIEADLVVRQARLESEQILREAQDQLALLEDEIGRCKLERDLFEQRLRGLIDEHVTLLERRRGPEGSGDLRQSVPPQGDSEVG
jgi:cell division initiation protein